MQMILSGEPIDASTALAWGLVSEVCPNGGDGREGSRLWPAWWHGILRSRCAMAKEEVKMAFEKPLDESLNLKGRCYSSSRKTGARACAPSWKSGAVMDGEIDVQGFATTAIREEG